MRPPTRLLLIAFSTPLLFAGAAAGADDEWSRCGPGFELPERPAQEAAEADADPETIHLSADEAEFVEDGVSVFTGNVTLEQGTRQLRSGQIVYNQSENVIEAKDGVRFWDDGLFVSGASARTDIEQNTVTFGPTARYMLEEEHGHGDASEIGSSGAGRLSARDVTYTTCNPGEVDWRLTASQVEFDRAEDTGTARNMWLEFKGQRVMYLPWMSFPLSSQRKSGFLTPSYGTSGPSGVEVTVPYYFNLAPNFDATVAARAMSDRGVQAQGEFRFLSRSHGVGRLAAEHLPSDLEFDDDRTAIDFRHRHDWSDRIATDARFEWVSDGQYLEDLGANLSQSSRSYLPRRFDTRYWGDGWNGFMRFQEYMTLDPALDGPYAQLPRILATTQSPERNRAPNFDLTTEFAYFEHESRTTGTRLDLHPSLSFPMHSAGAFVTPKAALHVTGYDLNRADAEATLDGNPSRVLSSFSLDGGLLLERPVTLSGNSLVHTIEPRIYYLLVPYEDQNELPRFDTSLPSFSFAQLFRENRFLGGDRFGDANQVTLALTSRMLDDRGGELVRASVGQIRHFRDRKVTLDADGPETTSASDLVAEIEARPRRDWRLRAGIQYDPEADRTEKNVLNARYQPNQSSVVNAGYRLVRDPNPTRTIEQAELSFAWPIGANWRTVGRWNFALNDDRNRTVEALGGLEYESCCWGFRVVARRFRRSGVRIDGDNSFSNGLYVQLELKGLTGVGNRTEGLLTRSIPGYENDF